MIEIFFDFYDRSFAITLLVIAVLVIYFFFLNLIFFFRYFHLKQWYSNEKFAAEKIFLNSSNFSEESYLNHFLKSSSKRTKELMNLAMTSATKEATKGTTFLSIVASTSPFIGLLGTVISILQTFSHLASKAQLGALNVIAAGVSDALVATAVGIFVAIFAYTYHQILKRLSFELIALIEIQTEALMLESDNIQK